MHPKLIFLLTTILVPIILLGTGLRLLLTPIFIQVEYNMPGFPEDRYGFSKEDRLRLAPYAVDYLVNREDISYLGDLTFEDGTSLYNERELSHMHDVKVVTQGALNVFYLALAGLALIGLWSRRGEQWQAFRQGLKRGGWVMIWLAGTIAVVVVLGMFVFPGLFWAFFAGFHALFFEGGTWQFAFSDTLIRLFPLRFWQDAFLYAAVIAVLGGLGLAFGIKETK